MPKGNCAKWCDDCGVTRQRERKKKWYYNNHEHAKQYAREWAMAKRKNQRPPIFQEIVSSIHKKHIKTYAEYVRESHKRQPIMR